MLLSTLVAVGLFIVGTTEEGTLTDTIFTTSEPIIVVPLYVRSIRRISPVVESVIELQIAIGSVKVCDVAMSVATSIHVLSPYVYHKVCVNVLAFRLIPTVILEPIVVPVIVPKLDALGIVVNAFVSVETLFELGDQPPDVEPASNTTFA